MTPQGYKGILNIIDHVSKFIYIYPIKTKAAVEISQLLINYISAFGTPKTILTDQGNE